MSKNKVVIIGAGPAGLTAAYQILKKSKDFDVVVLEGSNEIGGISKTVEYHGNRMDIGGHRFFSKDQDVVQIWNEVMPMQGALAKDDILLNRNVPLDAEGPDPEKEDRVMLTRHRVSRILYLHKFFDYPISLKVKTFTNMGFGRTMKAGFGYLGSCFHKRKEINLENFYINRFGKPLYSMFFEKYTEKVWGRHPSQIDASWGAQRVKGLSLWKTLGNALARPFKKKSKKVETSLIEQFSYPKKGPGQLYEQMAELVKEMGGQILMEHNVKEIVLDGNRIVKVVTDNNKSFEADYFISSMPIKDLVNAIGKDNLPEDVYTVGDGLVYRDFITVGLLLDKLAIKNETKIKTLNNLVPDTWIYVQEEEVKLGRIQVFNNWSPYLVKDFENKVWIGLEYFANEGDELWEMDEEAFKEMAIKELVQIKVIENENDVLDKCLFKVKKAYPGYFETYKDFDVVKNYLLTIDNLFCVGRNGQHRYNNMDHSMLTAMRTADYLIDPENQNKADIWEVNTEKSYHETKEKK